MTEVLAFIVVAAALGASLAHWHTSRCRGSHYRHDRGISLQWSISPSWPVAGNIRLTRCQVPWDCGQRETRLP